MEANLFLKCTKIRLVAGLCPHPLGVLVRSPRTPSCNGGLLVKCVERGGDLLLMWDGSEKRKEREDGNSA